MRVRLFGMRSAGALALTGVLALACGACTAGDNGPLATVRQHSAARRVVSDIDGRPGIGESRPDGR